ncbi:hypothetical protein LINPERHAP2_LOCUS32604 [Linum perenne]
MALDELADWEKARERPPTERQDGDGYCGKWHPPELGTVKCNSDAALFVDEGRSEAGMVIRDRGGRILKHMRLSWKGVWNSNEVEAKAALEALSWLEGDGWRDVILEVDAEQVARAIRTPTTDASEFGELIGGCVAILNRNPYF